MDVCKLTVFPKLLTCYIHIGCPLHPLHHLVHVDFSLLVICRCIGVRSHKVDTSLKIFRQQLLEMILSNETLAGSIWKKLRMSRQISVLYILTA